METKQILVRQQRAPEYLDMSRTEFNNVVRPYVTEIRKGRSVYYKYVDLVTWADKFAAANGRPGQEMEEIPCQKEHQALEKTARTGTYKKSLQVSSFDAALEKRNSKKQNNSLQN